ncbi:XRE family transcriptional regulator [Burkholderia sp. Bp9125]|nr:XRE family transcriptional regulator [Burkholderia sp. Bp9125]
MLTAFGAKVRQLRIEQNLLLKNMADALGRGSALLSSIEVGRAPLTAEVGAQVLEYFRPRVSAEQLDALQQVIKTTLELHDGGARTVGPVVFPFERREPEDFVAAFALALKPVQ